MHEAADDDGYDVEDEQSSVVPFEFPFFIDEVDVVLIVVEDEEDKPDKNEDDNDDDQNEC